MSRRTSSDIIVKKIPWWGINPMGDTVLQGQWGLPMSTKHSGKYKHVDDLRCAFQLSIIISPLADSPTRPGQWLRYLCCLRNLWICCEYATTKDSPTHSLLTVIPKLHQRLLTSLSSDFPQLGCQWDFSTNLASLIEWDWVWDSM